MSVLLTVAVRGLAPKGGYLITFSVHTGRALTGTGYGVVCNVRARLMMKGDLLSICRCTGLGLSRTRAACVVQYSREKPVAECTLIMHTLRYGCNAPANANFG